MTSLLSQFVSKTDFESYEDFEENFKILVPENFNFAYDIVDAYAGDSPEKLAMIWCDDNGEERSFTFKDLKYYSDKAANFFAKHGIGKGDYVMLTLKSRYEFWYCILALHKLGAIAVPATHMLKTRDIVYRIEKAGLKMIVCVSEDGVPEQMDEAHSECGNVPLKKAVVGGKVLRRRRYKKQRYFPCLFLFRDRWLPENGGTRLYLSSRAYSHRKILAERGR
jgi:acetyl-CoA synthetase